jgi:hypothetical protein
VRLGHLAARSSLSASTAVRGRFPKRDGPQRPTVAGQRADEDSLLHTVRDLITLRRRHPELGPAGTLEILHDAYPLVYLRGGRFLVVINLPPRPRPAA